MVILIAACVLGITLAAPAAAQTPELPTVTVTAPPPVAASSEILIPRQDFELRPQGRPADVLRLVPGLVLGQHQGGGKAEQYLLRGFDADHGTDVALFVDGMPVNLRSHAHGQGYADLHFVIPETLRRVEVFKGPYHVEFGDFATAGAVNLVTLDTIDEGLVEAAGGSFGTHRYLTLFSPSRERVKTLVAVEGYFTDGPFERAQNYQRFNAFARATANVGDGDVSVWASHLRSGWHASGQIPTRAVRAGLIDRFGAIDDSEGGDTQRTSLNARIRWRPSADGVLAVTSYAQYYTLDLFSDFTFFLDDPALGDGIEQSDRRWVAGFDARYDHTLRPWGLDVTASAGLQYRLDRARVVLARQADRQRLSRSQDVDVREQSFSPLVRVDVVPISWLRLVAGARGDVFHYAVRNNLDDDARLTGNAARALPSVKANAILGPWLATELFVNYGTGFHSNDARAVILDQRMPAAARAEGWEVGVKTRALPRSEVSLSYWALDLESELVFAGDAGTTEARGPSRRRGVELAARVRLLDWLALSGDVTVSRAEFETGEAVPLAPRLTARADLTARLPGGVSASLAMRHLADRFASEDRTQTARGYTLFDLTGRYRWRDWEAFLSVENLTDIEWREAQFFFVSRLRGEPVEGVPDVHFTPGNPRSVLGGIARRF
jgi:outer membrane receptor protein involved in Fe transport